mgnify:CR=1 FL=1
MVPLVPRMRFHLTFRGNLSLLDLGVQWRPLLPFSLAGHAMECRIRHSQWGLLSSEVWVCSNLSRAHE